ncbi:MAG TPA: DUF2093 domain-containing protein [Rhabdaerophilum sp.]|nr:DUF2093 domain-containing protein [Rhabdaerophilum sp.]
MPTSFATPGLGTEAVLEYSNSDYQIVRQGTFVRCAVTGQPIPLDDLHYWNAETQEAYSGPEAALRRLREAPKAR